MHVSRAVPRLDASPSDPRAVAASWRRRRWAHVVVWLLCAWAPLAFAEGFAVPSFPPRGDVPVAVADAFMEALRDALTARGVRVTRAPLVTAGIAGSLEPAFGELVASLEGTRYAVLGEFLRRDTGDGPYAVDLVVVDAIGGRSSDLVSRAFGLATQDAAVQEVVAILLAFTVPDVVLPAGDAGLFISTTPSGAEVRVEGTVVGMSGSLDLLNLAPGRYEVEVRMPGYLPEVRSLELRGGDTRFVHVVLTEIAGGSLQIVAFPDAEVWLEGRYAGTTPATLTTFPGDVEVELRRPGFVTRSFTLPVRSFRVTRLDAALEPLGQPMIVWSLGGRVRVLIDAQRYEDGYAMVGAGLRTIEVLQGGEVRRWLRAVPEAGVFELDLATGELRLIYP